MFFLWWCFLIFLRCSAFDVSGPLHPHFNQCSSLYTAWTTMQGLVSRAVSDIWVNKVRKCEAEAARYTDELNVTLMWHIFHIKPFSKNWTLQILSNMKSMRMEIYRSAALISSLHAWVSLGKIPNICTLVHSSEYKCCIKCFEGSGRVEKHYIRSSPFTFYWRLNSIIM